jgi:regulator of replication initiation timing
VSRRRRQKPRRQTATRVNGSRVAATALARLESALQNAVAEIETLKREIEIHILRMGAMQVEIDHLRAQRE